MQAMANSSEANKSLDTLPAPFLNCENCSTWSVSAPGPWIGIGQLMATAVSVQLTAVSGIG